MQLIFTFHQRWLFHSFVRYLEITKDNIGHGSGAVIRYFVFGGDAQKAAPNGAAAGTGDVSTSELDLVGSAVLHGCVFGPTKNPRGSFKHCIRIDFAKEFQPVLQSHAEVSELELARSDFARAHRTPQKLVLCLTSETEKKEWLQALTDAMAMTEAEQAATTILLSALSRNAGKQFEQAVAKLVSSDPGDDRIRELLSDILTQLMGPNAVTQNIELVRDGLNCIGTLVERMPNKMKGRAALNMFVPATITQTDSSSATVSQAALQVLATTVRCCKEHVLPFFYGIFQSILRHIDSSDREVRAKAHSLNDALMKLTEIKNAKELWQRTLDKHLELILTAVCDSERGQRAVAGWSTQREKRLYDLSQVGSTNRFSASQEIIMTAAAASKLMLEFRFQWLELLLDRDKLDFSELGASSMLPHAVVTLLDAACIGELRERAHLAAQIAKSMYASMQSKRQLRSISVIDTELAKVLVSKTTSDHPFFVRNLAFMFVANFFEMHDAAAFPYYASFVRNVLVSLPHNDLVPCARSVHEQMQATVRGPPSLGAESSRDLLALIHAVTSHLDACSHLECSDTLQWIITFTAIYPNIFAECMSTFLPPFMRLLVNCDGCHRLSGPEDPSNPSEGELRGCAPIAIELFSSLALQQDSCVKLVEALVDCLSQLSSEALLQTTREVVGSLFASNRAGPGTDSMSPVQLFTQICVQLQLKQSEQRFCHLMSHSLVSLLFVKADLRSLRDLLSNIEASADAAEFFDTCFKGFSSNPVALIALCFFSRMYALAASVIHSFADWELNQSFETEVQYVVRLLQGPAMQSVRHDLHGGSGLECRYEAWWALNALLAIM